MRKLKNSELPRLALDDFKKKKKSPLIIILDNVRSLNNIGSVFRTSDAFLIEKVYLCGITACPPHKEIHKTALGATDSVDWEYAENTVDLVEKLNHAGVVTIAVEQADKSVHLNNFMIDQNHKYALIFGNEVKGVQQSVVDRTKYCLEIPQYGTKHSLNISVSCGVVVWDLFVKMGLAKLSD